MTWRAVVRYPADADKDTKRKALRAGIEDICMELIGELDVSLETLEQWLEDGYSAAEFESQVHGKASGD